jgi:hypothetical protein
MTPQELQRKVELETIYKSADKSQEEKRLIQGKALLQICREKLYRGKNGGRLWEDYLKEDSHNLTANNESIQTRTAQNLRAFYMFRVEILPKRKSISFSPSATHCYQLLGFLPLPSKNPDKYNSDDLEKIEKAIKIWTTACGQVGADNPNSKLKLPNVNTVAELAREQRAKDSQAQFKPTQNQVIETPKQVYDPSTESANRYVTPSYEDDSPPIKTYEQERNTQEIDPYSECKKLHDVIYAAEKSLQDLHGVLYHQINKYGSAYLDQMTQFDAGMYSVDDLEDKIAALNSQTEYLVELLDKDLEPNDLVSEARDQAVVEPIIKEDD